MTRLVSLWVWLVTAVAPPEARDRHREELASHHWDARAAGMTSRQLALATARGALDDLRWCRDERALAGWSPFVVDPVGSTLIAGICIVGTLLNSLDSHWIGHDAMNVLLPGTAAAVLVASFADTLWRRRGPSQQEVDDPIFP